MIPHTFAFYVKKGQMLFCLHLYSVSSVVLISYNSYGITIGIVMGLCIVCVVGLHVIL